MSFAKGFLFDSIYEAARAFGWNPAHELVIAQPNPRFARIKE
jgi:hypothetical protein